MREGPSGWVVRLTEAAESDVRDIVRWTHDTFGKAQAETYLSCLFDMLERLGDGPRALGVRHRDDVGMLSIKVRVKRREGRHVAYFEVIEDEIVVMRILHDAMDAGRHLGGTKEA